MLLILIYGEHADLWISVRFHAHQMFWNAFLKPRDRRRCFRIVSNTVTYSDLKALLDSLVIDTVLGKSMKTYPNLAFFWIRLFNSDHVRFLINFSQESGQC